VVPDFEAALLGHCTLPRFDGFIKELLHVTTVNTHDVIVVRTGVQLEYGESAVEMMPADEPGGFELCEHPIDCG
jgi:hypothetical protein